MTILWHKHPEQTASGFGIHLRRVAADHLTVELTRPQHSEAGQRGSQLASISFDHLLAAQVFAYALQENPRAIEAIARLKQQRTGSLCRGRIFKHPFAQAYPAELAVTPFVSGRDCAERTATPFVSGRVSTERTAKDVPPC